MTDLLMILPTRGRPANAECVLASWGETRTGDSRLLLAVDDDDPELAGYLALPLPEWASLIVGPRSDLRMGGVLNRLAVAYADSSYALGFQGDDHRPRTRGFDRSLVSALHEMGTGVAYGNDLLQREALPTAVALTADIVRVLGYMVPPGLVHLFMDNYWLGLGQALGRLRYLDEVVIEHVHPLAKTAEWDQGYRECNSQAMYARDHATFMRWVREDSPAALAKLRALGTEVA